MNDLYGELAEEMEDLDEKSSKSAKRKRKKKRSNRNKKKRGLFSRIFGSAPDSKKAEEKEKVRKDASALSTPASFPLSASMGPQSIGSERSSLRRHGSSFRNERSVLLGKPTTKFDHYSTKFTED